MASGAAAAQHKPAGAPAVAPIGDAAPPADLPAGAGPSGTSGTPKGPVRFDQVGYAAVAASTAHGEIAAWGSGLPNGFAEVTDLATGHTVLVKSDDAPGAGAGILADLSPEAAKLLGLSGAASAKVRIREVQPIAADEVALEQGRPAAPRLDAPPILLTGLRAQLAQVPAPGAAAAAPAASSKPAPKLAPAKAPPAPKPAPAKATSIPEPAPAKPAPAPAQAAGRYHVRVASFANQANAKTLAGRIDGRVTQAGKYWRVELGPFADAAAAKRARDGVAKRGYGDARVVTD